MKIHVSYLTVILILIGLLFLQQQCQKAPEAKIITTHDTIPGDPFPVLMELGKPDPLYVDQPYFLPSNIDTMGVIIDYFSKVYYADTIKNDSSALIVLYDSLRGNRIINRSFSFQNRRATQINNTTILPDRTKLYAGAFVNIYPGEKMDFGPSLFLMTKRGYGYSYAYGINEKSHTVSFVWKISLKRSSN